MSSLPASRSEAKDDVLMEAEEVQVGEEDQAATQLEQIFRSCCIKEKNDKQSERYVLAALRKFPRLATRLFDTKLHFDDDKEEDKHPWNTGHCRLRPFVHLLYVRTHVEHLKEVYELFPAALSEDIGILDLGEAIYPIDIACECRHYDPELINFIANKFPPAVNGDLMRKRKVLPIFTAIKRQAPRDVIEVLLDTAPESVMHSCCGIDILLFASRAYGPTDVMGVLDFIAKAIAKVTEKYTIGRLVEMDEAAAKSLLLIPNLKELCLSLGNSDSENEGLMKLLHVIGT